MNPPADHINRRAGFLLQIAVHGGNRLGKLNIFQDIIEADHRQVPGNPDARALRQGNAIFTESFALSCIICPKASDPDPAEQESRLSKQKGYPALPYHSEKPVATIIIGIIVLAIVAACIIIAVNSAGQKEAPAAADNTQVSVKSETAPLTVYWTPDSAAAKSLIDYVSRVTNPEDIANFIPEKDRIAIFDMDGTLTCETYYTYYDTMMFIEYCLVDHPEKVSDEIKQIAASIRPGYLADETLARNFAKAYAGMTVEEFSDYVVEFGKKETLSFNNMHYNDGFYLPMVELVKYLYDNGFTIYVISGTERTTARAIVANSPIRDYVTPNHVIGTDFEIKQKGHETESSNLNFKYVNGDDLVLTGGFIQKNLNGNKSIYIEREIGQRPVLAFGNSGSDTSMMNYTIDSRNPYPAQAYMIVADDNVREWGTQDWSAKSEDYSSKGYIPVSMKNDFARIYPEGITPAGEQFHEIDWSDVEEEAVPDAA